MKKNTMLCCCLFTLVFKVANKILLRSSSPFSQMCYKVETRFCDLNKQCAKNNSV